jgi:hypothetical protein
LKNESAAGGLRFFNLLRNGRSTGFRMTMFWVVVLSSPPWKVGSSRLKNEKKNQQPFE